MLKTALFDCAINEKSCNVDGGRGICPIFSSPPKGIWQLKSSHPREFSIQGKQNDNARGSARRGRGGGAGRSWNRIDWCITSETLGTTLIGFAYIEWLLDMAADKTKPYTLQAAAMNWITQQIYKDEL